jgi:hypothetical protein
MSLYSNTKWKYDNAMDFWRFTFKRPLFLTLLGFGIQLVWFLPHNNSPFRVFVASLFLIVIPDLFFLFAFLFWKKNHPVN